MDFSHSAGGVCFAACPKLASSSPGVPAQRLLHFQCWASCPMMHYTQLFPGCPAPEAVASQCWANCPFTLAGWGLVQAPDAVCVEGEAGAPQICPALARPPSLPRWHQNGSPSPALLAQGRAGTQLPESTPPRSRPLGGIESGAWGQQKASVTQAEEGAPNNAWSLLALSSSSSHVLSVSFAVYY